METQTSGKTGLPCTALWCVPSVSNPYRSHTLGYAYYRLTFGNPADQYAVNDVTVAVRRLNLQLGDGSEQSGAAGDEARTRSRDDDLSSAVLPTRRQRLHRPQQSVTLVKEERS